MDETTLSTSRKKRTFWYAGGRCENNLVTPETLARLTKGQALGDEDRTILDDLSHTLASQGRLPFEWTVQEQNYLESHDEATWLPYLIYRYKMKCYYDRKKVSGFPVYVLIEPVSVCNLRCVMCFQVDREFKKREHMGMMDFDLFKRIIDEAHAGGTKAVTMASRGEPTLHQRFDEMLAYASGKFIDLKVNTNATKLTETLAHTILSSDVNELVFSIDASDRELYEKIRRYGNFDEVLANIRRFHDIREKHYPDSRLNTRISGVLFHEEQDVKKIEAFWSEIVDSVAFVTSESRWDTYHNPVDSEAVTPCRYLWEKFYVWFDGRTNPCDLDYRSFLNTGNLTGSSIRDIWHGDAYRALREAHLSGNRKQFTPCDRCGA